MLTLFEVSKLGHGQLVLAMKNQPSNTNAKLCNEVAVYHRNDDKKERVNYYICNKAQVQPASQLLLSSLVKPFSRPLPTCKNSLPKKSVIHCCMTQHYWRHIVCHVVVFFVPDLMWDFRRKIGIIFPIGTILHQCFCSAWRQCISEVNCHESSHGDSS